MQSDHVQSEQLGKEVMEMCTVWAVMEVCSESGVQMEGYEWLTLGPDTEYVGRKVILRSVVCEVRSGRPHRIGWPERVEFCIAGPQVRWCFFFFSFSFFHCFIFYLCTRLSDQ